MNRALPDPSAATTGDVLTYNPAVPGELEWTTPSGGGGSGDSVTIDGSAVVDVDLDDATPAAPSNAINVVWQKDASSPANVSGSVLTDGVSLEINAAKIRRAALTGDVTASAGSNTTTISSSVITAAARTVLDDATVAAMLATLGGVPTARTINTTAPLTGGGDLSANRTIAISDFVASGASHARGAVPDPGAVAGTSKFLREDASWQTVSGTNTLSRYDPDALTATSLVTPSQEFADAQSAGGWTNTFDPAGTTGLASTIGPNGLELTVTSPSAGYSLAGVYHSTFPVGDFAVLASFTLQGHRNKNVVGLVLMEGNTSTSDLFFAGLFQNTSQNEATRNAWSNGFTAYNTIGTDRYFQVFGGSKLYVFIRYNSSTSKVMVYLGKDPDSLINIVADLAITTPTKLGLVVNCGSTDLTRGTCQFVRVASDTYSNSDAAVLPRLTGARVTDH